MLLLRRSRLGLSALFTTAVIGSLLCLLSFSEDRHDNVQYVVQKYQSLQDVLQSTVQNGWRSPQDPSGRRIGKVTMMFGNTSEVYSKSLRMHEQYAARWGYKSLVLRENIVDPFWYSKQAYLLSIMLQELAKPAQTRLEWLFWADLDVIITNPEIPLSQYLPPSEDNSFSHIHLLISRDYYMINAGTFFIRVSQWSVEYLSAILAFASLDIQDCPDQRAMAYVLYRNEYNHNVAIQPQRWFNAYLGTTSDNLETTFEPRQSGNDWVAGDLQIHLAGGELKPRLSAVLDTAIRERTRLAIPVDEAQVNEVEAFWDSLRTHPQSLPPLLPHGRADLPPAERNNYAYLLMLTENHDYLNSSKAEIFLTTIRMLTYQILHDPVTKSPNGYPVLILCSDTVPEEHKAILRHDGATVVEVDTIRAPTWEPGDPRWVDNLTKFQAWKLTQYDKIAMIDADIVLLRPLDGVFHDYSTKEREPLAHPPSPHKPDEPALPSSYILAAGSEQYERGHAFPPKRSEKMNAGFFVFRPSQELYDYYVGLFNVPQYWNVGWMDQGLLNYAHRKDGPMPWHNIEGDWNVNWSNDNDIKGGIASIHEKWYDLTDDPQAAMVDQVMIETRKKMFKYYDEDDVYLEYDREQAALRKAKKEKEAAEKAEAEEKARQEAAEMAAAREKALKEAAERAQKEAAEKAAAEKAAQEAQKAAQDDAADVDGDADDVAMGELQGKAPVYHFSSEEDRPEDTSKKSKADSNKQRLKDEMAARKKQQQQEQKQKEYADENGPQAQAKEKWHDEENDADYVYADDAADGGGGGGAG